MARPAMSEREALEAREALLDAAQMLYEAGGAEAMTFRAIADAYGCSNTMPYSYFDSKADIIDGLRIRAYEWLRDALSVAVGDVGDPLEAVRVLGVAYVRAASARPRMYELLYSHAGAMDETAPELVEAKLDALQVCQRAIEAAVESLGITLNADSETTAHLFWIAAHGLVSLDAGGFLVVGRSAADLLPVLFTTMSVGMTREKAP